MKIAMKSQRLFSRLLLVFCMMSIIAFASPVIIHAEGGLTGDGLGDSSTTEEGGNSGNDDSISDYLKGYTPVTDENMQKASKLAGPIASAIGTCSGFIIIVVSAGIFLVTALDLCYIGLPFTRNMLAPQAAGGGAPMGGMGMGGMMGGMMGGAGAQAQPRKWVSDEAIQAVAMASPQGGAMGGSPMMGGGMGMGMGAMGGMMGGAGAQPQATKSVILTYLKKRSFFIIVFTVCTILLMSSIFTDCGINLAELLYKVLDKFNGEISNVNVG